MVSTAMEEESLRRAHNGVSLAVGEAEASRQALESLRSSKADAATRRAAIQLRISAIELEKVRLETTRDILVNVHASVNECWHIVDQSFNSAKTLDNQMSLSNFMTGVRGLAEPLQLGQSFLGNMAKLDAEAIKQLDEDIVRIKKLSENKMMI